MAVPQFYHGRIQLLLPLCKCSRCRDDVSKREERVAHFATLNCPLLTQYRTVTRGPPFFSNSSAAPATPCNAASRFCLACHAVRASVPTFSYCCFFALALRNAIGVQLAFLDARLASVREDHQRLRPPGGSDERLVIGTLPVDGRGCHEPDPNVCH